MSRTTAALATLVLLGGLTVAAIAQRPSGKPEVGALPSVPAEVPSATDGGSIADADGATSADPSPVLRPDGPTGKPGDGPTPVFTGSLTADQLPVLRSAPSLTGIDGWLQADGIESLDDRAGSVRVVQFWTFSCSNCKATIPNLQALRDDHADRSDFEIIGVHYPEFAFEEDPAAVADAAADLGVTWPIALDTRGRSFHGWQEGSSGYWPRTYVLDRDGRIRFDHVGEGRYDELNATVAALLAEG